ncbi:MAG: hypothetical protein M5U26_14605 [Planctomycetota bacterium]|nr:hypothetical protein [Planctomycetota bacterium]
MPATLTAAPESVSTLEGFQEAWEGNLNFRLTGECAPFEFDFPPLPELVDLLRRDEEVRILRGGDHGVLDPTDIRAEFRRMPLERALESRFHLSHFKLNRFYGPGRFLHGFEARVMEPWQEFLRRGGFTWNRCYPIFFLAGPGSGSSYHMDCSHVVAWQLYGTKIFSGLREPDRFSPLDLSVRNAYRKALYKPELKPAEVLAFDLKPGDALWNQILTPHWVDATDEPACSLNLSHGLLRREGKLCPNEAALDAYWHEHPDEAWREKR